CELSVPVPPPPAVSPLEGVLPATICCSPALLTMVAVCPGGTTYRVPLLSVMIGFPSSSYVASLSEAIGWSVGAWIGGGNCVSDPLPPPLFSCPPLPPLPGVSSLKGGVDVSISLTHRLSADFTLRMAPA